MIPEQIILELRTRVDAVEVVGQVVDLKKAGRQWKGRCPFHEERTPSFFVHQGKGLFRCHGCGEAGDAIQFVMKTRGVSFPDAVRALAVQYGLVLENGKAREAFDPAALKAAWEERQRQREEAEAKQHARAARRYNRVWNNAKPASAEHPYLRKKRIPAEGLRQVGKRLIIPMSGIGDGEGVMSLQIIDQKGFKRFAKGGRAQRTRTTIGKAAFKPDGLIYVAEGYATAASIHAVTRAPVIVAFSASYLMEVARYLRAKYPVAKLIFASDNDRWSATSKGPNPGVTFAREAAAAVGAEVAIPDFQSLDGRPSDFNDLFVREGELAVRRWIDPARSAEACTIDAAAQTARSQAAQPASAPEPTQPEPARPTIADEGGPPAQGKKKAPPNPDDWREGAPFRALGYDRGTYYYLVRGTGQVTDLSPREHSRQNLTALAPLAWWGFRFPSKEGVQWDTATDALLRWCEGEGVYHPERLHGRGAWVTTEGPVLHLGDRLLMTDKEVRPDDYKGDAVYERGVRLKGPAEDPMTAEEGRKLLEVFQGLRWRQQNTAPLLAAGWTALAPLCGALPWRAHIWLVGGAGSGKTTIIEHLITPLLGGLVLHCQGSTTEAGVRQTLRADALPVVVDEAEGGDMRHNHRVQGLLALARDSSSDTGGRAAKGTTSGTAMNFRVRSMFCFASIGGAVRAEADKTRISLLQLRSKEDGLPSERQAHWAALAPRIAEITEDTGRRLVARMWGLLPQLVGRKGWISIFRRAAAQVLGDARSGDQYGMLYAGAWALGSDEAPTPSEALDLIRAESLEEYVEDQVGDGLRAVRIILDQRERIEGRGQPRTLSLSELVHSSLTRNGPAPDISAEDADRALKQFGLLVTVEDNGDEWLIVANQSEWLGKALRETPYADGWRNALLSIPGAYASGIQRFTPMLQARTVAVPLAKLRDPR